MTRLSQILFAAAAVSAVPLTAFAEDPLTDPPADPNAGGGGDGAAVPPVDGGADMTAGWPKSAIDRPLTVLKGKLGASADVAIAHASITILGMTTSSTNEGLVVGAGYGISDKLEVGGSYAFSLNEFEIKGVLTAYGAFALMHKDKLDVAASADLTLDLNHPKAGSTSMETDVGATINAGVAVRYKVAPKFAVFTGTPNRILGAGLLTLAGPGPMGQQLSIGLNEGAAKTFSLPVGFGMQVTPELFAYLNTSLITILLSDPPAMGDRVSSIADITPLTLGGLFSVTKNIDAAASLTFFDLQNAGDLWAITVGARYYN